jgi:hypothetical protein
MLPAPSSSRHGLVPMISLVFAVPSPSACAVEHPSSHGHAQVPIVCSSSVPAAVTVSGLYRSKLTTLCRIPRSRGRKWRAETPCRREKNPEDISQHPRPRCLGGKAMFSGLEAHRRQIVTMTSGYNADHILYSLMESLVERTLELTPTDPECKRQRIRCCWCHQISQNLIRLVAISSTGNSRGKRDWRDFEVSQPCGKRNPPQIGSRVDVATPNTSCPVLTIGSSVDRSGVMD